MKFNIKIITSIFIILALLPSTESGLSSYLKIDLVEAVNLHCKLNNEFYCNPYGIIEFKHSSESKTSKSVECTKHPKWESSFTFSPELCKDVVYVNLYQYLTPRDNAYLDTAKNEDEDVEKGDYKPGYLGRVILELEKIPHGLIDDWFMLESPSENTRIVFPSCVHLRIYWTSSECSEPAETTKYQIQPSIKEDFLPKNYIPMCKKDFALIYKTKFSRIESEEQIKEKGELENISSKDISSICKIDMNRDYGFLHKYSNLTSIEEALVYKIIKRTTGENINYEEFSSDYSDPNKNKKYLKSYKEFFEHECFIKPEMTIERVNNILKNDAESFPKNTTNYFLSPDLDKLDYTEKNNLNQLESVYKDTLNQFYAIEDIKNLKTMDDDSYIETLNKLTKVIKTIHAEKKIDETIFEVKNKLLLTSEGLVNPKEEYFFRIYALYKWNGGQYQYDDIKREFMLRRKYFDCYERVDMMPTNIIFQFVEDICPNNYICVDPNGIVINSVGRNPNEVFAKEILETKLNFLERAKYKNKNFSNYSIKGGNNNSKNLRFRENNANNNSKNYNSENNSINNPSDHSVNNNNQIDSESDSNNPNSLNESSENQEKINFEDLIKMETILPPENPESEDLTEPAKVSSFIKKDSAEKETKMTPYISTITYKNKFDVMYEQRMVRIKKKKEVIINKIFNHVPLLGEILSIANLGADTFITQPGTEHVDQKFLDRERDLLKKYLLLYDANIPYVEQASKVLLDLILCNNDKNSIAYVLRELLEGLCYGDDRSIKIFEEIVRTVIIDALVLKPYFYFPDLNAKVNLLNTLNKPLCYKAITKIRFLELMLMYDFLKEKITFIIYNNDTNKKISERIKETETSIPETLPKNKRNFSLQIGNEHDYASIINTNYLAEMDRIKFNFEEKKKKEKLIENESKGSEFRFKSVEKSVKNNNMEDEEILNRIKKLKNIMNDDLNKNNFTDISLNNFGSKEFKIKGNFENMTNPVMENKQISNNVSIVVDSKDDDLMNEFKDFLGVHYKNSNFTNEMKKDSINKNDKIEIKSGQSKKIYKDKFNNDNFPILPLSTKSIEFHDKEIESNTENTEIKSNILFKKSSDNFPKFKSLNTNKQFSLDSPDDSNEFAKQSLNQYNNPNIYDDPADKSYSILSSNKQPSSEDILNQIMKDPHSKKLIENIKDNSDNKIIYPKEIHTIYEVDKKGTKQITVNNDNPTKKMILDKLMDEKSFNDMMNQEEKKEEENDQTGLYTVLKNIQNRKCSLEFLCIEIGAIYGPFDNLKPKDVTIMTKHKENVHVIIKPIILVNNTVVPGKDDKPIIPSAPIFDNDDDCDILKISNEKDSNIYNANMRFKQLVDRDAKQAKLKRKFYRKVEIGNEILATEIFKQGLNLIILKREKGYPKIFERTYSTNTDPIESDAMACVLKDTGYDKVIVITGIGKWMGAITPRLVKEIKQIGGPNLNYLITADGEDNSMADHSFILIGRRGLCRYNGVFRVKNYDISADMKKYFPDLSSDPNDCYFDDIKYENEKNKIRENQFFHLIDLRLTLDLCNDNRFSTNAPVITSLFPNSGPLNGGQLMKIRGLNFGAKSLDIKEVLIRGVICKNVNLESPFLITCISGSSTIMGPGFGNVEVKLLCGFSSPHNTCNLYEYTSEIVKHGDIGVTVTHPDDLEPKNNNNNNNNESNETTEGITVVDQTIHPPPPILAIPTPMPLPIIHEHLPIPGPMIIHQTVPHSIFERGPSLFSFKEKQLGVETQDNNDTKIILDRLKNKEYFFDEKKQDNVKKIDNLVSDNFKNILSRINSNSFMTSTDGFRKRRFKNLFEKFK